MIDISKYNVSELGSFDDSEYEFVSGFHATHIGGCEKTIDAINEAISLRRDEIIFVFCPQGAIDVYVNK